MRPAPYLSIIKNGFFRFPDKSKLNGAELLLVEEFETHLKNLIRERSEDSYGKPVFKFKGKIENHFAMALNSLRLSFELMNESGSDSLPLFV